MSLTKSNSLRFKEGWRASSSARKMPSSEQKTPHLFLDSKCLSAYRVRSRSNYMEKKLDALGPFEQLVLTAVYTLGDDAYGVTIHSKVSELAEKNANLGSIYITLDRLSDKGLVRSWEA